MMYQFKRISRTAFPLSQLTEETFYRGAALFGMGLIKKVFIADRLAPFVDAGFVNASQISNFDAWQATLSYSFQLYFDFSGYCDIAIGISYMLGIALPINFNSPYKSHSVREFWRRWHITLSRWLRDYIYIPLGGNLGTSTQTLRNLILTFVIGGFWHGASWTFIIWGMLHGLACCIEHIIKLPKRALHPVVAISLTFLFVNFAWIFFRSPDLNIAISMFTAMFVPNLNKNVIAPQALNYLTISAFICWTLPTSQSIAMNTDFCKNPLIAIIIGALVCFTILSQNNAATSPFLYFNF
jgi:D-alanyl-lipoteichoic acid acyltransferase DltB (MBOAT superfamily)